MARITAKAKGSRNGRVMIADSASAITISVTRNQIVGRRTLIIAMSAGRIQIHTGRSFRLL